MWGIEDIFAHDWYYVAYSKKSTYLSLPLTNIQMFGYQIQYSYFKFV